MQFENGDTEHLHVTDIQDCQPAPMFERTLRAGDNIEYEYDHMVNGPQVIDATVLEICESAFTTSSRPTVITSRSSSGLHPSGKFRILRSEHSDAPMTGK